MHALELPRWLSGEKSAYQYKICRNCGFEPWVRKIPWRRTWQPTPVFLPGKSYGQNNLSGYSPWGHKESETSWELSMYTTPAMKREQQVGVTGLCREVRQTKQEVNWQIKGANTKWRQQNNCLLLLTCGLSFYPSERFDSGLALTGSIVRLCEAEARTGLQRAEDSGGPGQGHLAATVSREARLHPGEPVPGEAGRGERWP